MSFTLLRIYPKADGRVGVYLFISRIVPRTPFAVIVIVVARPSIVIIRGRGFDGEARVVALCAQSARFD